MQGKSRRASKMVNRSSRGEMSSEARKNGNTREEGSAEDGSSRKRYHLRASSREVRSKIAELAALEEEGWCEDCFKEKGKHRKYAHLRTERECATARERGRMHALNDAFDKLRRVIPNTICSSEQKLSKIATLRQAIYYISMLANVLNCADESNKDKGNESEHDDMEPMGKRSRVETASESSAANSSGTDYESQSSPDEFLFAEDSFESFLCDLAASSSAPSPGDIPFNEEFQYHL